MPVLLNLGISNLGQRCGDGARRCTSPKQHLSEFNQERRVVSNGGLAGLALHPQSKRTRCSIDNNGPAWWDRLEFGKSSPMLTLG